MWFYIAHHIGAYFPLFFLQLLSKQHTQRSAAQDARRTLTPDTSTRRRLRLPTRKRSLASSYTAEIGDAVRYRIQWESSWDLCLRWKVQCYRTNETIRSCCNVRCTPYPFHCPHPNFRYPTPIQFEATYNDNLYPIPHTPSKSILSQLIIINISNLMLERCEESTDCQAPHVSETGECLLFTGFLSHVCLVGFRRAVDFCVPVGILLYRSRWDAFM